MPIVLMENMTIDIIKWKLNKSNLFYENKKKQKKNDKKKQI